MTSQSKDEESDDAPAQAPRAPQWRPFLIGALVLAVLTTALLVLSSKNLGYARDEAFYFHAARRYSAWFELLQNNRAVAMRTSEVDAAFAVNHEHPALMKSAFGLSNLVFYKKLHWFSEPGTSFRFPSMVLAGLMVGVTFLWAARQRGSWGPALAAGLGLLFMPNLFYHAHLACFDVPIAAMFLFTLYAYDRTLHTEGIVWPALTGIVFGLALDTKHNSWFLPIAITAHATLLAVLAYWTRQGIRRNVRRSLHALVAMAALGPIVCIIGWPWLWHDTWARWKEYAAFHMNHDYYNMEFLGENYFRPPMPRGYAPLMTLATIPLVTLLAAIGGLFHRGHRLVRDVAQRDETAVEEHSTLLLWILAIGVSYGAWISTNTPIFGGTKHWMNAYPFIALLSAEGVARAAGVIREELELRGLERGGMAIAGVVAVLALGSPVYQSLSAHPWGLSAYTPLVGGAQGAASLGLNRTFWGYTTGSLVDYLNREVPKNGAVYPHDTAWASWEMLQLDGRLRKDIRAVWAADEADVALYHHEMHMQGQEYQAWIAFGSVQPDIVEGLHGVPVIWAYKRQRQR